MAETIIRCARRAVRAWQSGILEGRPRSWPQRATALIEAPMDSEADTLVRKMIDAALIGHARRRPERKPAAGRAA